MKKLKLKCPGRGFGSAVTSIKSAAVLLLWANAALTARGVDNRVPELPPDCTKIAAPEGSTLVFHVYAVGVQIYRWDGTNWPFVAPEALLYADADLHAQVGTHFGTPTGPAWKSTSGSQVIEQRVDGCTP